MRNRWARAAMVSAGMILALSVGLSLGKRESIGAATIASYEPAQVIVRASCAVMTQASGPLTGMQLRPVITLPLAMIGPEDCMAGWVW